MQLGCMAIRFFIVTYSISQYCNCLKLEYDVGMIANSYKITRTTHRDVCCTGLDMHKDIDRHVVPGICT